MKSASWRTGLFAGLLTVPLLAQSSTTHTTTQPAAADPSAADTSRLLWLTYGTFDPTRGTPPVPPLLRAGEDVHLWVVQFRDRPTDAMRDAVRAAGGEVHGYLPYHSYVVRMDAAAAVAVHQLVDVRWVGPYEPAWRLEPALVAEHVRGIDAPTRRYNVVVVDKHRDKPALARGIEALGGRVVSEQPGSLLMTVDLDAVGLLRVARLDQVLWIDRWSAPELDMNNARQQGGGAYVESVGNFRGQGVRGHVYEGVEATHPDFTNTPIPVDNCGNPDDHGHCTAGIVFGNGTSHPNARGMAPDAQPYYTNFSCVTPGLSRWLVIQDIVTTHECLFTTASWGDAVTTSYNATSADSDDIVFDHDIPWTQSQSNTGNRNSRPQAWAKNVISIGGVQHFDDANPANDSWAAGRASIGPASDGRIKPELCAYFDSIWTSDLTGANGYDPGDSFTGFNGTSGATPIVAGHNAIALQMFTDGIFGNRLRVPGGTRFQNRPHFSTLKAMMIASAAQYAFNASSTDNLRVHQGYGFPDLRRLYDSRTKAFLVDEAYVLRQGQQRDHTIRVAANEPELRITMVYSDPAGNPAGGLATLNDLTLRVTSPSGTVYYGGNGLDTGNWSTPGGVANTIDTVECVFVQNPAAGDWRIEILATLVAFDSHVETVGVDADYALAVLGAVEVPGGGGGGGQCLEFFPANDNDATSGSCNNVPFGTTRVQTSFANQRYQTVMPAADLGGAAVKIIGLGFAPCGSGLRTHDSIVVTMSHVPAGYALSTSFAANLPNPVVVVNTRNFAWTSTANTWSELGLQAPFFYNGTDDVVVDIVVRGSNFPAPSPEFHRGNNPRLSAFGWTTSPPATGTLASIGALKMRMQSGCASITPLGVGCSTLRMASSGQPILGQSFTVTLTGATPAVPSFLNFGLSVAAPLFPFDLTPIGAPGCYIYHDPVVGVSLPTDPSGHASLQLNAPATPSLSGGRLFVSGIQLDSAHANGAGASDYLRIVFGN